MWIFTSFGVFMPAIRPASTVREGDAQTFQVRARRKWDLERLRDNYMPESLGRIERHKQRDYEWRANCTPQAWADAVAAMSLDIDYESFKPTVPPEDETLHKVYLQVWSVLFYGLAHKAHQDRYFGVSGRRGLPKKKARRRKGAQSYLNDPELFPEREPTDEELDLLEREVALILDESRRKDSQ